MVELDADSSCFFFFRVFSDLFFYFWKNFGTKNQLDNRGVMLVVVLKVSKNQDGWTNVTLKKWWQCLGQQASVFGGLCRSFTVCD